jgi:hypothetical protein
MYESDTCGMMLHQIAMQRVIVDNDLASSGQSFRVGMTISRDRERVRYSPNGPEQVVDFQESHQLVLCLHFVVRKDQDSDIQKPYRWENSDGFQEPDRKQLIV